MDPKQAQYNYTVYLVNILQEKSIVTGAANRVWYKTRSSAYIVKLPDEMETGNNYCRCKSRILVENISDLSTDPWGTPETTGQVSSVYHQHPHIGFFCTGSAKTRRLDGGQCLDCRASFCSSGLWGALP